MTTPAERAIAYTNAIEPECCAAIALGECFRALGAAMRSAPADSVPLPADERNCCRCEDRANACPGCGNCKALATYCGWCCCDGAGNVPVIGGYEAQRRAMDAVEQRARFRRRRR